MCQKDVVKVDEMTLTRLSVADKIVRNFEKAKFKNLMILKER